MKHLAKHKHPVIVEKHVVYTSPVKVYANEHKPVSPVILKHSKCGEDVKKGFYYKILEHTLSKETDENGNELDNWILNILDSDNDTFPVDMKDFISWMSKKFKFTAQQDPNDPNTYIFINEDGDEITRLTVGDEDTDISAYKGIYDDATGIVTITVRDNKTLQDAFTFDIDVGYLKNAPDKYATDLNYSTASKKLRLQRSDGEELETEIPIPTLPNKIVTNVVENGDNIVVTYQDGTTNTISIKSQTIIQGSSAKLIPKFKEDNYVTVQEDYDGCSCICMNGTSLEHHVTITKPADESFVGDSIWIRKTNGDQDTLCYIDAGEGVTINPSDANVLSRNGDTKALWYVGNGKFEVLGAMPIVG